MRKFVLVLVLLLLLLLTGTTMSIQEQGRIEEHTTDDTFISCWNTTKTSWFSSASDQIKLPLESSGIYDFVVNWGDGTSDVITAWDQVELIHTYESEGIYNLTIDGTLDGWRFNNRGDMLKILDISQWGELQLGNNGYYFAGAANLQISATDTPDLSGTTNLAGMFSGAFSFNSDIGDWNVSSVTNMPSMFSLAKAFNQPIGDWDVSNVTNMDSMFSFATSFNQPIGNWVVSNVTSMNAMFEWASSFNQPIGNWDVSTVYNMGFMFSYATSFNQPIGDWDVSMLSSMYAMFKSATSFNQNIGDWDVSNGYSMVFMFSNVTLSTENYDNLLIGWAELQLQIGVNFDGGNSLYSSQSTASRQKIIDNFSWTITDGGATEILTTVVTDANPETTSISNAEDSEDAFLDILHFYTLCPLLAFAVIRIRIVKKNQRKIVL